MTEDDRAAQEPAAEPAPERTFRPADTERAFLRLSRWQTVLSLAGVFTGAVALYAALTESRAVRQQTEASVWPFVQVMVNDHIGDEDAHLSLEMSNVGVGPARLRAMRLRVDGRVRRDWRELTDALLGPDAEVEFGINSASRRVLAPGESVTLFSTADRALVAAMQERIYSGRADLAYCYCSIFDSCWLASGNDPTVDPRPVEDCPDYGPEGFRN